MEDFILLAWHVLMPTSPRQSVVDVWALSTTTTEAINREPQRAATGATAALTATALQQVIAQRTPSVAPQKKSWRSQAEFCRGFFTVWFFLSVRCGSVRLTAPNRTVGFLPSSTPNRTEPWVLRYWKTAPNRTVGHKI